MKKSKIKPIQNPAATLSDDWRAQFEDALAEAGKEASRPIQRRCRQLLRELSDLVVVTKVQGCSFETEPFAWEYSDGDTGVGKGVYFMDWVSNQSTGWPQKANEQHRELADELYTLMEFLRESDWAQEFYYEQDSLQGYRQA